MLCIPIQAVNPDSRAAQFHLCEAFGVNLYRDGAKNIFAVHETFDHIPAARRRARSIVAIPSGWEKIDAATAERAS
jgi:hypothetical protein